MPSQTEQAADGNARRATAPGDAASDEKARAAGESARASQPADAVASFSRHLAELVEYATYYISAKADSARLVVRSLVIYAALAVIGLVLVVAALATAVVLAFVGLAGVIGGALHHLWLGHVIVGVGFLVLLAMSVWIGLPRYLKTSRLNTVAKYEWRKHNQHERFGRHV